MQVEGAKAENGTNIQQWNLTGGSQQEWRIIATENGYCKIVSMTDESKAVTVDGANADNGLNIQIATYTGADNQQFKLIQNRGFYGIVSKSSADKAGLDVYGWSEENGGNINQWEYWGGDCQLWYITPVYPEINDSDYVIKSVNSGLWLSYNRSYNVFQGAIEYIWSVKSTGDGYYQILNQDGKALTVQDASAEDGKDVYLADSTGDISQKFNLYTNNDGSVSILTAVSGSKSSLDVYGISQEAGANICQWNYWGGVGQQWILTPAVAETSEPETETELVTESATEASLTPDYGDVNEDGSIDILDVISLNRALLGKEFLSKQGEANADVNEDTMIDSTDALNIMKYIVQIITSFPVK